MFTETVEDWLMISLDHESFNQHRRYFTHVAHHCLYDAASDPLPSFCKVGWRKLWRKSDVLGTYSPFLYRDYSLYSLNAFETLSSAFDNRQKLPHVCQSYRECSQHLWHHFYTMTSSPWRSLFAWRVTYILIYNMEVFFMQKYIYFQIICEIN